ncbi:MAG: argininosuccinate lyase [Oscillospiraceae bacterium]|nr:argininosuccinate lyase [Oscillospiraceae bacterium]
MSKLWAGRTAGETNQIADDFNSSIRFDCRMYREDIKGSMAHAAMLGAKNIISKSDADAIIDGLQTILDDLESGALEIDPTAEDIHMFVEQVLTERIGETGKRLHTARSRNDQVALDLRMYLRAEVGEIVALTKALITALADQAEAHKADILPGYTHLQRAQPVTFGHHLMAYAMMLLRDVDRMQDALIRMNVSPIGCCALAGTTYDTDRIMEAEALGFDAVALNSLDGVSDRDFCVELLSAWSILMMHLSRLSEELILWSSWEFQFISLSDDFTTGSSIMPQKKNPDMAELCRGKTGRVYGDLMALLTTLKGLPLAYNKDMQEDKEAVFDAVDTVKMCLKVFAPMIETMTVKSDNMLRAAQTGFINATDLADYLVKKGMPFRSAYKISGALVAACIQKGVTLEELPLEAYKAQSELFDADLYDEINLAACAEKRSSLGGTSVQSVENQIAWVRNQLDA